MIGLFLVQFAAGVAIAHAPCPAYLPARVDCYDPAIRVVYIVENTRTEPGREALAHEYGHVYDFDSLTDPDRARFQRLLGYPASVKWWGKGMGHDDLAPAESFAEAYAACAVGRRFAWSPSPAKLRRICALLPRSAYAAWKAA